MFEVVTVTKSKPNELGNPKKKFQTGEGPTHDDSPNYPKISSLYA